ncbi:hypothetical protein ACOZ2B_001612 [Cronobacter sakazakii]
MTNVAKSQENVNNYRQAIKAPKANKSRQPSRKTKVSRISVELPSHVQIKTDPYQAVSDVFKS